MEQLQVNRDQRAAFVEGKLLDFVQEVEEERWSVIARDLWGLLAGLHHLAPDRLGELPERIRNLPTVDDSDRSAAPAAYVAALANLREEITNPTYELLQRAASVGEVQLAVELMREILRFDPDHPAIRKGLGHVRLPRVVADNLVEHDPLREEVDDSRVRDLSEINSYNSERDWASPFDAQVMSSGLVWNPTRGWMPMKHADRYAQGYVYDSDRRKWTTLSEANVFHGRWGRDWVLRTEHLEVRGTADLESLAQVATQLEQMYDQIFWVYAPFFADGRRHDPLQLALGLVEHAPLVVWVYRDHEEYVARADAVKWSAGIFRPDNGTCYFYGRPSETMYHEFTHQVLHVMTGKNKSPSWLTEAIAQYTETVEFGPLGVTFTGHSYAGILPLPELFDLVSSSSWYEHFRRHGGSAYAEAGSVATFCMEAGEGRFRADFIDFVRDSYRGQTRRKRLWDYLGLSEREFTRAYHTWGAGPMTDLGQLSPRSVAP